ncbi:PCP reductase family protein [Candidatus Entotheonella palauensis]|uniref:PCP reductase family protein n=1 Tax=Candidatus Entotheonella palauensis TaxID=93172 RepID=UPI000B7C9CEC|nr:PCP reductase family protein [Candidatus Entotheonella palauensis]
MKFLCVTCDEALQNQGTEGPVDGVLTVRFGCPGCGWEMAMYMNPWETQSVRSLDVKIGGQSVPAEPMQMMRSSLSQRREDMPQPVPVATETSVADEAPKCPFADVVAEAFNEAPVAEQTSDTGPLWTAEAEKRVSERIPGFVLPMARMGIEKYARERGYREITPQVLDEAKDIFMG